MKKDLTLMELAEMVAEGDSKSLVEASKENPLAVVAITLAASLLEDNECGCKNAHEATEEKSEKVVKKADKKETKKEPATKEKDLSSKTSKELYEMCIASGIKANKYGKPKSYYLDLLADIEDDECDEDDEKETADYDEMTAPELFKLCKERGIKVEPKKKAAEYIKLLVKDDEAQDAEDEEDDDWEEEEKPASKGKGKPAAKSKKDDEDDWEI